MGGVVRVRLMTISGTVWKEDYLTSDSTVLGLQTMIKGDLKPEWSRVIFHSDDGSQVEETEHLRDHGRLTCHGILDAGTSQALPELDQVGEFIRALGLALTNQSSGESGTEKTE